MAFVPDKPAASRFVPDAKPEDPSFLDQVKADWANAKPTSFLNEMSNAGSSIKQFGGDVARGVGNMITGGPMLVADAISQGRNMISPGSVSELPSETFRGMQDSSLPAMKDGVDQFIEGATSAGGSALMPSPTNPAVGAVSRAADSLARARAAGYVVPPNVSNPTTLNAIGERLVGQKAIGAAATSRNLDTTATNFAEHFDLPKGTEISHASMDAVRADAGKAYDAVAQSGPGYQDLVDTIKSLRGQAQGKYRQIAQQYNPDVEKQADDLWKQAQQADDVLAGALKTDGNSALMDQYLEARKTIAQTHQVDKTIIDSLGKVTTGTLANAYKAEKPLTGPLMDAGRSHQAFSEAFTTKGSPLAYGPDAALLGSGAGLGYFGAHDPKTLIAAALAGTGRYGARKAMLSGPVQDYMAFSSPQQKQQALAEALLRGTTASQGQ